MEQIYRAVGISRSFFYTFFPTKEDLIVETLYLQQPRILEYARALMADPALSWREAVRRFLHSCCYGEQHGLSLIHISSVPPPFKEMLFYRLDNYSTITQKPGRSLTSAARSSPGGAFHASGVLRGTSRPR